MDHQMTPTTTTTTTTAAAAAAAAANSSYANNASSSSMIMTIADSTTGQDFNAAVVATPHLYNRTIVTTAATTTTTTRERSQQQQQRRQQQQNEVSGNILQALLAEQEFARYNNSNSNSSNLPTSNKKVWSNEELQEAAMLFQDETVLRKQQQQREGTAEATMFFVPSTTIVLILVMFVVYIHQFKMRQSKRQVLVSYRLLVQKRAIHKIFLAIVSHPPRTTRRRRIRGRRASRQCRQGRRPYHHSFNGLESNVVNTGMNWTLRWQLFVYSAKNQCTDCLVQAWKATSRGHVSGLPLLLYNALILWSCRDLEKAVSSTSSSSSSVHLLALYGRPADTVIVQNSNSNNHHHAPLHYLRLLVALAFLTFGLELVITYLLLQSPLLEEAPSTTTTTTTTTDSSSDTTAAAAATATAAVASSLTITATDLTVVNASGDEANNDIYNVGLPGPPLSGRSEYQTRQQRESAQERRTFWRRSLLYKPMGTMTAVTTALLWIHRAQYFHQVHVLTLLLQQAQQQQQQQEDDEHEGASEVAANGDTATNGGDHDLYPSFNVLPLLVNPFYVSNPTSSATLSWIEYGCAILLLLILSRFNHPGWAVFCGCIVGMLWGPVAGISHDHYNDKSHNESNTIMTDADEAEGFLHFIAQPYYGDWLMSLLILFSLLSLKRTRKWSGWLPFIDYVAWGSSSSGISSTTSSISCRNTSTANSGGSHQDQQQRQSLLRRAGARFMVAGRSNEQEAFGFMDDEDQSRGNDSDEDTDSESSQSNANDDQNDYDFLVGHDTGAERQRQSVIGSGNNHAASPDESIDNSDSGGGEIYGRLPSLGDFLDDEDDTDGAGDLELALHMSLQEP
jgi:hypothetical protein